jgi:hypothetical protein
MNHLPMLTEGLPRFAGVVPRSAALVNIPTDDDGFPGPGIITVCEPQPCPENGWQRCQRMTSDGVEIGSPFTRACRHCDPCSLDPIALRNLVNSALNGQPVDLATLRFISRCVYGGQPSVQACERCSPETRIDLPDPVSDRCIQICCPAFDPSSCFVKVRVC